MVSRALTYGGVLRDYLLLTKPGIVLLVLITTLTGMYFAQRGFPDPQLVLWTLLGTGLASAGSAGLNQFFDRDIDAVMERTRDRPLPSGSINPRSALLFSLLLLGLSAVVMLTQVNLLATLLVLFASLFYVVVYTLTLKRRSSLATEVGGISGAMPPVVGYAAVKGEVGPEALVLFLIMFLWQPPHFWVLAIKYAEDYKKAGIPTLPVAKGIWHTKLRTLLYTAGLLPVSLLPSLYGFAGHIYFLSALFLSLVYLALTVVFTLSKRLNGTLLFFYSVFYMALLFSVMVFDMRR
ncbi:MAG: heme o synthase [Aquificaceae bacterium]|nr:heme o synthase [Aquificaceae bacterium]MCX8060280.1 heme o synthase [Aquificaceae bacterium]MDW8097221.1 heme o synthase [Aquificaceae bacterium]